MRILILICRILVGSLFIVSGLIKANDPLGFSYKLEEYFAESALNMPGLMPYALRLAVLACLGEIVPGFAVLVGGRLKLATVSLVLLTIFFGWLTAFTGTCNDRHDTGTPMTYTIMENGQEIEREMTCVSDCGCFGDAMKGSVGRSLTPWESFSKDAILFILLIPILLAAFMRADTGWNTTADDMILLPVGLVLVAFWSWIFTWWGPVWFTLVGVVGYLVIKKTIEGVKAEWITAAWVTVITLVFTWYCFAHLPIRDYRPYAVGNSIVEQRAVAKPPVNQTFVSYKKIATGEVTEFDTSKPYPWNDSTYVNVPNSTRVVELEPGILSQVSDFLLTDGDGNEITEDILAEPTPVLLIMMYNVESTRTDHLAEIAQLADTASKKGWYVYGVSANTWEDVETMRHEHQLSFDFLQCDEKTVKTVIRSNPGILLLQQGTVRGKWHDNDVPDIVEVDGTLK